MMKKLTRKITRTLEKTNFLTTNVAISAIFLDQFVKFLIRQKFVLHETLPVFKDVFHVTYVRNFGAALGFLKGKNELLIFSAVASISMLFLYSQRIRMHEVFYRISLGLLLGGAMGNLIDRVMLGHVVDYFDLKFFPAIFNLADLFIDAGVAYLFYRILTSPEESFWPFMEKRRAQVTYPEV